MPSKGSHANGNGHCKVHSRAAMACRLCLIQGLQEFRHANLRAGIRLAKQRVAKLRATYLSTNGAEVKAAHVATALTSLLAELDATEKQVEGLPGDAGVMIRAMSKTNGHRVAGRAS